MKNEEGDDEERSKKNGVKEGYIYQVIIKSACKPYFFEEGFTHRRKEMVFLPNQTYLWVDCSNK